jgi:glutamine synthetase
MTNFNQSEVMQYVQETDVKFIRLAFCDVYGRQKNLAIMPSELERAFHSGIAIDASSIQGFGGTLRSDLFLHPEPSTLTALPWRPQTGRVVQMFCRITRPDGSPFEADSREVLRRAVHAAEEKGYAFAIGSEMEFYLFRLDENGEPTKIPYDRAGYMDIAPEDKGENVRREICLTLEQMGMKPECSHHESGPGQNEIDFRYADPLTAADNAILFRTVVRAIAAQHGLWADFSPRPLPDHDGSGMHLNISLKSREGESLLPQIIAGILDKIREMTVFFNPVENSYQRLGRDKAPGRVSWSAENRSQLIRIPAAQGEYRRVELRSPDSMANPYLAIALVLHGVMDGIEEGVPLPEPMDSLEPEDSERSEKLPETLEEAKALAAKSVFLKKHIPDMILEAYCRD